jgi:hypothetical protein
MFKWWKIALSKTIVFLSLKEDVGMANVRIETDHHPLFTPAEYQTQTDDGEKAPTFREKYSPLAHAPVVREPTTEQEIMLDATVRAEDDALSKDVLLVPTISTSVPSDRERLTSNEARPSVAFEHDEPYRDADGNVCEVCRVTEACIDLKKSHAFLATATLIEALGEHFTHTCFADEGDGWLYDEYANELFVVTYCLNAQGRDQLRVRWLDPDAEDAHTEDELPALTRQIARLLGGGTNLYLGDRLVHCKRLHVPPVRSELIAIHR